MRGPTGKSILKASRKNASLKGLIWFKWRKFCKISRFVDDFTALLAALFLLNISIRGKWFKRLFKVELGANGRVLGVFAHLLNWFLRSILSD